MTTSRNTSERLFERYNTFCRRPTVEAERPRWLAFKTLERTLSKWLPSDRQASVVDVACGEGTLLAFLHQRGYSNLMGFDLSPENVAICHRLGLDFVEKFDALKFVEWHQPQKFDIVFAIDILEHLPKQRAASFVDQVRERLKPGGAAIVQTPNMGSVMGLYHRYHDLSHEFALTEKSVVDLMMLAGFDKDAVEVRPAWNAATPLGRLREIYLNLLHKVVFLADDSGRPKIATKNLLVRAIRR